jgi:heme exporter protein B
LTLRRMLRAVVIRDLQVAFRRWGDVASPVMFFAMVSTLFPLALSPEMAMLRAIGPAVLWIAALLSSLLSLNALFRSDLEDGTLEQLVLHPQPLAVLMLGKICAHWLVSGLPLVVLAPLLGITYYLPGDALVTLCLTLLLGTPILSLLGAIGAALTAGLRQAGGLLALLVLPLMLPTLMFGARATDLAGGGSDPEGLLYLMAAMLALATSLAPIAAAAAIRVTLD